MKKIIALVLMLVMIIPLFACGKQTTGVKENTPEKTAQEFIAAIQSFEFEKLPNLFASGSVMAAEDIKQMMKGMEEEKDPIARYIFQMVKDINKKITYRIKDSKIDGDNATVDISVEYRDLGIVFKEVLQELLAKVAQLSILQDDIEDEKAQQIIVDLFNTKLKEAGDSERIKKTIDITLKLVKVEDKWYLTDDIPFAILKLVSAGYADITETELIEPENEQKTP